MLAPGSFIRDVLSPLSYIPVAEPRVDIDANSESSTGIFAFGGSAPVAIAGTIALVAS